MSSKKINKILKGEITPMGSANILVSSKPTKTSQFSYNTPMATESRESASSNFYRRRDINVIPIQSQTITESNDVVWNINQ